MPVLRIPAEEMRMQRLEQRVYAQALAMRLNERIERFALRPILLRLGKHLAEALQAEYRSSWPIDKCKAFQGRITLIDNAVQHVQRGAAGRRIGAETMWIGAELRVHGGDRDRLGAQRGGWCRECCKRREIPYASVALAAQGIELRGQPPAFRRGDRFRCGKAALRCHREQCFRFAKNKAVIARLKDRRDGAAVLGFLRVAVEGPAILQQQAVAPGAGRQGDGPPGIGGDQRRQVGRQPGGLRETVGDLSLGIGRQIQRTQHGPQCGRRHIVGLAENILPGGADTGCRGEPDQGVVAHA
jgi:hypothetical protein